MKRFLSMLVLLVRCFGQAPQPTPVSASGSIAGTLTGEDGTLIGGAYLRLALLPPYPTGRLHRTEWVTVSGADGSFQFAQLLDGSYQICAQVPASAWLNPCEWGLRPPAISLSIDQPSATAAVILKKGAVVPIRLSDPSGLLSRFESTAPTAHVLIGVSNDASFFRRAQIISADATGRNHQVLIPFGATVDLIVCSSFFQLSNAAGIALPTASASIPVTVQPGQQPPLVTLVVTGGGQP